MKALVWIIYIVCSPESEAVCYEIPVPWPMTEAEAASGRDMLEESQNALVMTRMLDQALAVDTVRPRARPWTRGEAL